MGRGKGGNVRWLLGGFSCVTLGGDLFGGLLGDGVALGFVDLIERRLGGAGGVEVVVSHGAGGCLVGLQYETDCLIM